MSLEELLALLDQTPVVADIHPVSLCYLPDDVMVLDSVADAVWLLDDPKPTLPGRLLIRDEGGGGDGRFPHITCHHNPFTPALNESLFDNYDEIAANMLCQSQLAPRIAKEAMAYDLVIMLLIDGLSYQDVQDWPNQAKSSWQTEPCLVDVPTVTHVAFPNVLGSPTLAERLFDIGYHNRMGFTYWTREDNKLTNQLFQTIPNVQKTSHFPHIIATLRQQLNRSPNSGKSYIQIIRTGLDGYAHHQKRKPPIQAIIEDIRQEFMQLISLCSEMNEKYDCRTALYLTSDHGILWFDEFEPLVIGTAQAGASARWCHWRDLYQQTENGRQFRVGKDEYYCLDYPKLRRSPRIDEQGIHGGISFQESIVPFLIYQQS